MQPQNQSPPSSSDPTNVFQDQLGPNLASPIAMIKSPETGEIVAVGRQGRSGTYIFNGIITREEYNPDLMRWEALKNYDIMRRSDASVQAALDVVKLPILSATWTIEAGGDEDQDKKIADFVRWSLFEKMTFSDFLGEATNFLDFGYSVFEKIWDFVDYTPEPIQPPKPKAVPSKPDENGVIQPAEPIEMPEPIEQPTQKMIGLVRLESRKQRSIYRWQTNDAQPAFGITQYVPGGTYSIPGEKLVIFTRKKEGENYEGISLLRAMYKHWKMKDTLELIDAIRHERQGLGIIMITPPPGANESDVNDAIETARQARASEEAVIKKPDGWTIEWMDMKSGAMQVTDIMGSLEYHKREIMKSVLAQFLEMGSKGGSGSRATSQDHSALFDLSEEFTAKYIGTVINNSVIKELVDLNFSDVKNYPTLEHSKIGDDDLLNIGTVSAQFASAGLLTADADIEQWIRTKMHAPDLSDEARENYNKPDPVPPVTPQLGPDGKPLPPNPPVVAPEPDDGEQTKTASTLRRAKQVKRELINELMGSDVSG